MAPVKVKSYIAQDFSMQEKKLYQRSIFCSRDNSFKIQNHGKITMHHWKPIIIITIQNYTEREPIESLPNKLTDLDHEIEDKTESIGGQIAKRISEWKTLENKSALSLSLSSWFLFFGTHSVLYGCWGGASESSGGYFYKWWLMAGRRNIF